MGIVFLEENRVTVKSRNKISQILISHELIHWQ